MDEKRPVDYFLVAGLPEHPEPVEEFSDETELRPSHKNDPIVDIAIINKTLGETPPNGFRCVEYTPTGLPADLNHGSIRAPELAICYKRGREKPPLTDIGVLYEGKERVMAGCEVVYHTPYDRSANVNNSNSSRIYITFRRCDKNAHCNTLAVMDICVLLTNKGETAPHAFCTIEKNLNRAMVGSDVLLCYKKSMCKSNVISYKAAILGRYPLQDYPGLPLPERVPMFCLPLGASLESWPAKALHPMPQFSTFVLTMEFGEKVYGASVSFYEEIDQSTLTPTQQTLLNIPQSTDTENTTSQVEDHSSPTKPSDKVPDSPDNNSYNNKLVPKTVHESKCICVLSRWPFFNTFKKYLSYLYRISVSGPQEVPIERLISHFIHEVPFPSPQRPRILVQFSGEAISLAQPEDTPISQSGASYISLLKNLGPENCMTLLTCTLLEQKILIHSLRHAVLTSAAEAAASMVFPFHWQCPYIPLCPLGLSDVLCAPTPYIVGVDSRYFDLYDPPTDVVCVDLDTNAIKLPEDRKGITYKLLPKKPAKVFRGTLEKLFEKLCDEVSNPGSPILAEMGGFEMDSIDMDFSHRRRELAMETSIQEAFLRFSCCVLKGYNNYLLPITKAPKNDATDINSLFDIQGFLKTRDKGYQKFFTPLTRTQLFTRFIEERSFVSDKDYSLAFFDECTEKVNELTEEPRLIELDDSSKSERTVFILPPEPTGLPEGKMYTYDKFPSLDSALFPEHPVITNPLAASLKATPAPGSPMTRRTKQEMKSAHKVAMQQQKLPNMWAKCLVGHCYSLWFIHLPSYTKSMHSNTKALRIAYDVLVKMQSVKLQYPDEVCYRVLLHMCGVYQQPVLAVRVLFEMRQHGVQPNAITYGFYNKAVLESKWPTSDTNAYLLWTKVKHVVQAIAQFKQGLKTRRTSMYSNSGSECDGISRTSTDSFLDDIVPLADRIDMMAGKGALGGSGDLVNVVESPNCDERVSTGGMSDKGYSSMTLDDSKRTSLIISSEDSIDSLERITVVRRTLTSADSGVEMRSKVSSIHRKSAGKMPPPFDTIDAKTDNSFQEKIGSIVRKSNGSIGSTSTLRGSTCSSAGLLMTSQASIDESVFGEASFSNNLRHTRTSSLKEDSKIRRHSNENPKTVEKIQEEEENRRRSDGSAALSSRNNNKLLTDEKPKTVPTDQDKLVKNEVVVIESVNGDNVVKKSPVECVQPSSADDSILYNKADSEHKTSIVDNNIIGEDSCLNSNDDDKLSVVDSGGSVNKSVQPEIICDENVDGKATDVATAAVAANTVSVQNELVNADKTPIKSHSTGDENGVLIEDPLSNLLLSSDNNNRRDSDKLSQCSETPSNASILSLTSPTHSIRTPVLENDPLGLFNLGGGELNEQQKADGSDVRKRGKNSPLVGSATPSKKDKLLIDLGEPFSGTSTPTKSVRGASEPPKAGDGDGSSNQYYPTRSESEDGSSNTSSIPSSPVHHPLSVSHSEDLMRKEKESAMDETPKKASTLPANAKPEDMIGSAGKKGKLVGRSDSFMKSMKTMKSAATGFMSRFNTLKETTMATVYPASREGTGSTSSLPKLIAEEQQQKSEALSIQQKKMSSSLDMLGSAEDDEQLVRDMNPEDMGQSGRLKSSRGYTPFVRNLMEDWASKTVKVSNSAMTSMKQGLVTMKDSAITSLEGWNASEYDSDDEFYNEDEDEENESEAKSRAGGGDNRGQMSQHFSSQQDVGSSATSEEEYGRKGSAPPHSLLDNYIPTAMDDNNSGSTEGQPEKGPVKQGSIQSIPQLLYNCAMEVEICSLSRCNSCNALLYDEEIMAGWSADDSNLNTSCQFCNSKLVPQLQIYVKDYRQFTEPQVMKASQSMESMHSIHSMPTCLHKVAPGPGQSNLVTAQPHTHSLSSVASADNVLLHTTSYKTSHPPGPLIKPATTHIQNSPSLLQQDSNNPHNQVSNSPQSSSNNKSEDKMFVNSVDVPDISAVPKAGSFNRSSAVKLKTEDGGTSSSANSSRHNSPRHVPIKSAVGADSSLNNSAGSGDLSERRNSSNLVDLDSPRHQVKKGTSVVSSASGSMDTLDEIDNNEGGGMRAVDAETDSIGDVLDGELPYNRELKESRIKSITLEPISVPYLSPLVLRKEIENVITLEGDECLASDQFADEHTILYWNLIWYFKRLDLPSHLPGFMLTAKTTNKDQPPPKVWAKADSRHVQIRGVWDNLRIQDLEVAKPMYVTYGQTPLQSSTVNALVGDSEIFSKGTLQHIVSSIMCNDVIKPINMVMNDRRKNKHLASKGRFRSLYRDLLFLSFVALGRDNIDHDALDREYKMAYSLLSQRELARLRRSDGPPKPTTVNCRRMFGDLEL